MENWFQYILLIVFGLSLSSHQAYAQDKPASGKIDKESIEIGFSVGVLNIEDFPASTSSAINLSIKATEDFFLQANFLQTGTVELSQEEQIISPNYSSGARKFEHYDLLLGYNFFQGEFFNKDKTANLSALYLVGGVGETSFGQENRFSVTAGIGYRTSFWRKWNLHVDFRDYVYQSSTLSDNELLHNFNYSFGLSYLL